MKNSAIAISAGMLGSSLALGVLAVSAATAPHDSDNDKRTVSMLDVEYQNAVRTNDIVTISRILSDGFVLVTGSGKTFSKSDIVSDADPARSNYEHNEEMSQTVRVCGDTAIVTAKLWEKGIDNGKPFDHTFWFSDTYVRTPNGWRYFFGQSSLPLPNGS